MKPIIFMIMFFNLALSSPVFSQVIEGNLNAVIKANDVEFFSQEFRNFINTEFILSEYCMEGWGDDDGAEKMQKACKAEQNLINNEINQGYLAWMRNFEFDRAQIKPKTIHYAFHRYLNLTPEAPLSCVVFLELAVTRKTKEARLDFFDLYCDH